MAGKDSVKNVLNESLLLNLPEGRKIRVAFTLGQGSQVIDVAIPWEVFQDVLINENSVFELYTVGASKDLVSMSGGMLVAPNYSVFDAPQPDVIVSPAHDSSSELIKWLKKASVDADLTTSLCTGAYHLAEAGLLDGLMVTTFHTMLDDFADKFPNVRVSREQTFIDQGHVITAGGLSAGIDMSLHIVGRYFGLEVAQQTAHFIEYDNDDWKQQILTDDVLRRVCCS
tara:strand:- start:613 stop:1293 length:681 start_codon:yes stop_codon:yes gene_type:complete